MFLKENDVVLFQGDSITDCGRDRSNPNSMGYGYPIRVAGEFNMLYPELNVRFYNRGVSGNRTWDLLDRWDAECTGFDPKPTVVSVYIGVNDTWRRFDNNQITTAQQYEENYRKLLDDIKNKLSARIIMIEPYVLPNIATDEENWNEWRNDLDAKIRVCRKLAVEYNALYLPLDGIFAQAYTKKQGTHWSADGVHPTDAGHALITENFMKLIGAK
ncbi:MAG: SGNH/GDSL hydrolase family protein [Clostridia bacterium]|nr:SGNH/GDSL hydrolase family protein [Clostridia bacterium]